MNIQLPGRFAFVGVDDALPLSADYEPAGTFVVEAPRMVTYDIRWQASFDGETWHDMKPAEPTK